METGQIIFKETRVKGKLSFKAQNNTYRHLKLKLETGKMVPGGCIAQTHRNSRGDKWSTKEESTIQQAKEAILLDFETEFEL